jgi:hypothetical protein
MSACQGKPHFQALVKKEANLVTAPRSTLRPNAAAVGRFDHETYVEKESQPAEIAYDPTETQLENNSRTMRVEDLTAGLAIVNGCRIAPQRVLVRTTMIDKGNG